MGGCMKLTRWGVCKIVYRKNTKKIGIWYRNSTNSWVVEYQTNILDVLCVTNRISSKYKWLLFIKYHLYYKWKYIKDLYDIANG